MTDHRREYASWIAVLVVGALFFWGLSQCMAGLWHFDFFISGGDVHTYWQESLTWGSQLNPHHPPGYPLLIAIVRTLSAGLLSALAIMQSLSFLFLMGGAFLCIVLCRREGIPRLGWQAALVFIAWPFVGSLYAVYPQKDSAVLFFLILGLLLALDGRWIPAGAAWGVATWIHPLAWIFVPILLLGPWAVWIWEGKHRTSAPGSIRLRELAALTAAAVLPLIGFWIWKTAVTKDPFSIITTIAGAQVVSRGSLPILDGWIGTLMDGGISGWVKVAILTLVVLLAVYTLVTVLRNRATPSNGRDLFRRIFSAAIPVGILVMALLLNQHEIWAVVRFSKILILPLILQRDRLFGFVPQRFWGPAFYGLIAAGFATQVAYAWYMTNVFF
jgi:hypothetical protein